MIKQKYQSVLDLGTHLNIQNGEVTEKQGVLIIKGTAKTQYEKYIVGQYQSYWWGKSFRY